MRRSRRWLVAVALLALLSLRAAAELEPRALVLLRVEGADGRPVRWWWGRCVVPVDGEPPRAGFTHVAVGDGLGTSDERDCSWALQLGWPVRRTLLVVRPATTVGFAAFDQAHGLVEEVLTPGPATGMGSWSLRLVTLRLPQAEAPAAVTFDVAEPLADDPGSDDDLYVPFRWYDLHAPRTGLEVATLHDSGARRPRAMLPPGRYELRVSTAPFMLCGNTPPVRHEFIDVTRPFEVLPGEALTVAYTLQRGGWIALSATITGSEALASRNALELARRFDCDVHDAAFDSEAAWGAATTDEPSLTPGVDPLLHVTARLTPSAGGATFVPSFTCPGRRMIGGRRRAVLGTRSEMLEQLPPGEYELSLSGPRVAPWSTTVTLARGVCTELQVSLEPR